MKTRQDNDAIDHIGVIYAKIKTELSYPIEQDAVYHKNREDNDVANCIGVIFAKYDFELSRPIKQCMVYYKDKIGKQHDRLYKSALHRKRNWLFMSIWQDIIYDEDHIG